MRPGEEGEGGWAEKLREWKGGNIDKYEVAERKGQVGSVV